MKSRDLRIFAVEYAVIGSSRTSQTATIQSTTIKPLAELAKRGHYVTFLSATVQGSTERGDNSRFNMELVRLHKEVTLLSVIYFEFVAFWRTLKKIAHYDAIILDGFSVPVLFPMLLLRRLCSHIPVLLFHVTSNVVYEGGQLHTLAFRFLDALSSKFASVLFDKMLFISPMLGEFYSRTYGISPRKIGVWPSAAETGIAERMSRSEISHLRKDLGLEGRVGFLYQGSLTKGRGIIDLLQAFRILRDQSPEVALVLLGFGELREEILEYIRTYQLEAVVKLRGPVHHSEVAKYVAACDAGIVPLPDDIRWRYQCPIKVLEGLAMDKPLIVSDIPAHRWIIGNEPVAMYLKDTDAGGIAEGVIVFMKSINHYQTASGEKIVQARFTPAKIADMLESEILSHQG